MGRMKQQTFYLWMTLLMIISLTIITFHIASLMADMRETRIIIGALAYDNYQYTHGVVGVNLGDRLFCVNTEGKTPEQINYTFCHESCHNWIAKDYEHFCEDNN